MSLGAKDGEDIARVRAVIKSVQGSNNESMANQKVLLQLLDGVWLDCNWSSKRQLHHVT